MLFGVQPMSNDHDEPAGQIGPSEPTADRTEANRIPHELRQCALRQLTEEEIAAALRDLRELREGGGVELHEFIQELEHVVNGRERTDGE
jgi:hypothetical protein